MPRHDSRDSVATVDASLDLEGVLARRQSHGMRSHYLRHSVGLSPTMARMNRTSAYAARRPRGAAGKATPRHGPLKRRPPTPWLVQVDETPDGDVVQRMASKRRASRRRRASAAGEPTTAVDTVLAL